MSSLCITTVHPRICQFFNNHPNLIFDDMIVSFIEMLENVSQKLEIKPLQVSETQSMYAISLLK